jgi:hypothetical protein
MREMFGSDPWVSHDGNRRMFVSFVPTTALVAAWSRSKASVKPAELASGATYSRAGFCHVPRGPDPPRRASFAPHRQELRLQAASLGLGGVQAARRLLRNGEQAGAMKPLLAILLAFHGAIHLVGFSKAFEIAPLAQLKQPISRPWGVVWLLAGVLFMIGAMLLAVAPAMWWTSVAPAVVLSQLAIVACWRDAKLGTIPNVVVLVPIAIALLDLSASSYRSTYRREVERRLAGSADTADITERDLERLPRAVQTYLRRAGVVGRPHVRNFRARFTGQMRSKPEAPWMNIRAEQHEFFDAPGRLFLMQASLYGIPFEALHMYVGASATMQVKVASLVEVVDARGPKMDRSETVTLFNDMCLLAPGSLVDAKATWQERDERTVGATFTNAGNTIRAELSFDEEGDLVGFVSNDRYQSADGVTYRSFPWSTPVHEYRDFGGVRLAARGEAIWKQPDGDLVYARFLLEKIEYNVGVVPPRASKPAI